MSSSENNQVTNVMGTDFLFFGMHKITFVETSHSKTKRVILFSPLKYWQR